MAPCTSSAPTVRRPMPSNWQPWARLAVPSAARAARRSGWRGRRMPSKLPHPVPARAEATAQASADDAAAEWEALAREEQAPDPEPPVVDSPSIASDWPTAAQSEGAEAEWAAAIRR